MKDFSSIHIEKYKVRGICFTSIGYKPFCIEVIGTFPCILNKTNYIESLCISKLNCSKSEIVISNYKKIEDVKFSHI